MRIIRILIILSLLLIVFSNNLMVAVCFCGQTCVHSFQNKQKANSPFHTRCAGTYCKSCNFEDGRTYKIATFSIQRVNFDLFKTSHLVTSYQFEPHFFDNFHPHIFSSETFQSLPIYLQTLALRC